MIKTVGITGGIGSGKSMVCKIFKIWGFRIYEADQRAKELIQHNPEIRAGIIRIFGEEAYQDGIYNRTLVGKMVFQQPGLLSALNAIVHPVTRQDFTDWVAQCPPDYPLNAVIKEAAILFESGAWEDTDFIISVYAPKNIRIQRVVKRDGFSEEDVRKRMNNQWAENRKMQLSDLVIYNDGIHPLIPQVTEAVKIIRNLK